MSFKKVCSNSSEDNLINLFKTIRMLFKKVLINSGEYNDFIVPENYIFAMGDNRAHSTDCRSFGCIPIEKLGGVAKVRFWPLNKIGTIKKPSNNN